MPRHRMAADLNGYWLRDDGPRKCVRRQGADAAAKAPDDRPSLLARLIAALRTPG